MNLRSIKPADPVLLEATMGQWWQWPVVSLSSSLLNVSVYCGLLILSHNSVGIWGVPNMHTVLIMSTQSHPNTPQHVPLPPSCPLPTPSRFLFCNPLSYAPSQSFSVLNNETAAPYPPLLHLSTPSVGLSNRFWVVLISIYWGQNESCWNTRVHLNLPGSSFSLQCKWDHSCLPNFPGYMCIQWEWFFLVHKISFVAF